MMSSDLFLASMRIMDQPGAEPIAEAYRPLVLAALFVVLVVIVWRSWRR